MPKHRPVSKVYTPDQRAAIVGEIQRRQRLGSRSVEYLARQLGISDKTYYNWVRAGVRAPECVPASVGKSPAIRSKAARRYGEAERVALMAEIARRREAGQTLSEILASVDLGRTSYARWLEDELPAPTFRAVSVSVSAQAAVTAVALVPAVAVCPPLAPSPVPLPSSPLTLVAPSGYRIEGLAIESAAALLRALS